MANLFAVCVSMLETIRSRLYNLQILRSLVRRPRFRTAITNVGQLSRIDRHTALYRHSGESMGRSGF